MKADDDSVEFSGVLCKWKPESSPFSECCLAGLELQSTPRGWRFPGVSPWMSWCMIELKGFVLFSPSWFCLGCAQGRNTHTRPTKKEGLDKNGYKFWKIQKAREILIFLCLCHQGNGSAPAKHSCPLPSCAYLTCMRTIFGHCHSVFWSCTLVNTGLSLYIVPMGKGCFYVCIMILSHLQMKNYFVLS